ncbi:MAG: group II intron reverse transcriptase/maturase [Elusimicrobia bacterium]|nr:group II intron reverse transcriptase/maturase [Elusimicrobiota bacterium]
MTTPSISLQELRRRIYQKAKSEKDWRFWGLYVHVHRLDTLWEAYREAKANGGASGVDGRTFQDIEREGVEEFLLGIQEEMRSQTYRPMASREVEIPKGDGKMRRLKIPAIKDRVVQGALRLILEPIFEADFRENTLGYRPGRSCAEALERVGKAVMKYGLTDVIDVDLKSYFDGIRHHRLLAQVAKRVMDGKVLWLIKKTLKAQGKKGVPQGGPLSPLLANVYLSEVDAVFEKAEETTQWKGAPRVVYTRFADDIAIAVGSHPRWPRLLEHVIRRLREELERLEVTLNLEKTKVVNLLKGESFAYLGFDRRRVMTRKGKPYLLMTPRLKKRTVLLKEIRGIIRMAGRWTVEELIQELNPKIMGWVNYFRIGNAHKAFSYVRDHIERQVRRFAMRQKQRQGFGWKRWSKQVVYGEWGLFHDYQVRYWKPPTESALLSIGA